MKRYLSVLITMFVAAAIIPAVPVNADTHTVAFGPYTPPNPGGDDRRPAVLDLEAKVDRPLGRGAGVPPLRYDVPQRIHHLVEADRSHAAAVD